jgi:ABC-type sugar transport system substrate-binding protein
VVLRAIQDSGLAMPVEIALAGFDDTTWNSLVRPGITVIAQPTYEVGQTAVELLMRRLEDPTRSAREVVLRSKLVIRGSCARHTHFWRTLSWQLSDSHKAAKRRNRLRISRGVYVPRNVTTKWERR